MWPTTTQLFYLHLVLYYKDAVFHCQLFAEYKNYQSWVRKIWRFAAIVHLSGYKNGKEVFAPYLHTIIMKGGGRKITHYDYQCKYRFWKLNWTCICDKTLLEVFIISGHFLKILVVTILNTLKWHIFSIVYFSILMWLLTIVPEVRARQPRVSLNEIDIL